MRQKYVAPRAGAWIETKVKHKKLNDRLGSHPVRVRGLKQSDKNPGKFFDIVAPRAGAWIETYECEFRLIRHASHPVRVRGLKLARTTCCTNCFKSHPVRVRGLKHRKSRRAFTCLLSHPVRVRGLKHEVGEYQTNLGSRTPCGCVD